MNTSLQRTRAFFDKPYPGESRRSSPIDALVFSRTAALVPPGRGDQMAVDLGCHWGRYTRLLAESYGEVWGLDHAGTALASAPERPNLRYAVVDLEDPTWPFPFSRPADFFLAVGLFEMLRDPGALGRRLVGVARDGARLLIVVPNRRHLHYVTFRATLWLARHLLGRRSAFVFNNGLGIDQIVASVAPSGFLAVAEGTVVGLPPALVGRLPARLQVVAVRLDPWLHRTFGGAYSWALLELQAADARPTNG